jgi:hypothetical protein
VKCSKDAGEKEQLTKQQKLVVTWAKQLMVCELVTSNAFPSKQQAMDTASECISEVIADRGLESELDLMGK